MCEYLCSSPLGLYALSSMAFDGRGYLSELELDVRGKCEVIGNTLFIVVGEIKSGHDYKKAIQQLIQRLICINLAVKVLVKVCPIALHYIH